MNARVLRCLAVGILVAFLTIPARAGNPPPTQLFYVPFPEDQQLQAFDAINSTANDPITVFVTFSAATDGTVIYYDHWEDGYEREITNPTQSTTLVFGDGNPANGYPPGNAADQIPAGTVFSLRNFVSTSTLQSVLDYDARDKIASFKPISLTKTCFPDGTDTLLAGCVEVFERGLWGTEYRSPVGVDMPASTPTATLTNDENLFTYVALSISAGPGGASVQVDKDNDGVFEETLTLAEGESVLRDNVNTGGRVVSDTPVQVVLFTGTVGSNYASRDTNLLPVNRWSSDYYSPVSTPAGNGTVTFLYNPGASDITVNYTYRDSLTSYATASVNVPAGGNARVDHSPASGTTHYGSYRFHTTGANPPVFYAMSAIDADETTSGNNQNWDGAYTLVGRPSLTTQVLLSLGIGRDPYSSTSPTQNGNPMWICTVGNDHTPATVYVDYNGDNAGALTDPNGNSYDVAYSLRELQQQQLYDPDGDQSGLLVYTLDPTVKVAAAWAQDPSVASIAQPGLDVASLVPPLREGEGGKKSSLSTDADGDGAVSAGDTLEYDIRGINSARAAIPGPFAVTDDLPVDVAYVAGSTRYRFSVGGAWQAWVNIPDDASGTAFPLDGTGYSVPGNLATGQQLQVVFNATIKTQAELSSDSITNTGTVEISPYGLLLPIAWTDVIYGSIGDRVWNDLSGDGVQDVGENGIPNIRVFADLNNDGVWNTGEPQDTTDANGDYLLAGLAAGDYVVRVNPSDIAAVNVGYGPTYDLDGLLTLNAATVTLAGAEDRVDADFGYRVGASVGDLVWMDRDADGVQEGGEPGIANVRVYLDLDNDNAYDPGEPYATTSSDGVYYIGNLDPGTYAVRVDASTLPSGISQTYDLNGGLDHEASVTLLAAEHRGDLDFGYRGALSIGDLVWEDVNADGVSTTSIVYDINNGRIDLNGDTDEDGDDDGFIGSMRIIDGYVDITGNGSISGSDDGTFLGVNIVNGGFDLNNSGSISSSGSNDDGEVTYITSEAGIANVRVYIDTDNDGVYDATEPSAITDANGNYSIGNLFDGTYIVRVDTGTLPSSYVQTYDLTSPTNDHKATVQLSGSSRTDADFGYRNDASIGDLVWNDRNSNGVQDSGEPGIEGVVVFIDANNNNVFDQGSETYATTDVNGLYQFENLAAGTYTIRVEFSTLPQGSTQTYDLDGSLNHETSRTLATSENATDVDFGYRASASFGDYVWNDLDADGVQDGGEAGLSGVRVYADINGNGAFDSTEPSALTDSSGAYSIGNLLPGVYTARIDVSTLSAGLVQTYDLVGALDHSATFSLSANQARTDVDFGYTQRVTIGDFVWSDANVTGQQDMGEGGLDGVTVTVFNAANDTIAATTVTDEEGAYAFNLMPGTYYLVFETPAGYAPAPADLGDDATDSDAAVSTGRTADVTLAGGQSDLTLDAGFYQLCSIAGSVLADTDNDDGGDLPLVGVELTLFTDPNGDGDPADGTAYGSPALTLADGSYSFDSLPPGSYVVVQAQPAGYLTVSDGDATAPGDDAANASIGDNRLPVGLLAGESDTGNDFIEEQPGSISGTVLNDTDDDGDGDEPLSGVLIRLLDGAGNPVLDGFGQPVTTTTDVDGAYAFGDLPPGNYRVTQDQPANYDSVSDTDGPNDNVIGSVTPITVVAGQDNGGNDFIEIELGTISGYVFVGANPLAGVTLTLLDESGDPVDGDPGTSGVQPITTVTDGSGFYQFSGVRPGVYQVGQTQPYGYDSFGDIDGGNIDIVGDVSPITLLPGAHSENNNFIETLDTCPDDWAHWKFLHPAETPSGNPDADAYDNFAEFAFAMPHDNGTGSPWLGDTAWIIRPSTLAPGTLEGVFVRHKGAPLNVIYTLQYAASPGDPTVWQEIAIAPGMITTADNGDCTETVTIHDLETLTGLTGGKGVVRIKADLDDDGGNDEVDHTSYSEPEGWTETPLELCCRTYNNPYLRETAFTGVVSDVSGQTLTFAVSGGDADLAAIVTGGAFYLEVTSGDNEGHRFDIVSASGNTVTLASDASLDSLAAPFNTLAGAPPGDLTDDAVAIRRHWTLGELFPPTAFGATGSQSTADQVQLFAGGAWKIYWLYDDSGSPRWVAAADAGMADQGSAIIQPGQGMFFNNRAAVTSILAYGEVRVNDFVRPLGNGNNLLGGGYPIDQSATGTGSRQMNSAAGFFGSRDFKTADSFFLWNADVDPAAKGYATYFLLNGAPIQPALIRWVKVGDASIQARDEEFLFLGNRSAFIRAKDPIPGYVVPSPWTP